MKPSDVISIANRLAEVAKKIVSEKESIDTQLREARRTLETSQRLAKQSRDQQENIEKIIKEKSVCFPWLAAAFADYHALCEDRVAKSLLARSRRAPKAAEAIREAGQRRRDAEFRCKLATYRYMYYESLFPWLTELIDAELPDEVLDQSIGTNQPDNDDRSSRWLSTSEYNSLSPAERNEIALKRYRESRKSNWQIGRDYERYIGYLYECEGYRVDYRGALDGLDDLGRDLIVRRNSEIKIVQCKYWSKHKKIHEKHVFQLYGSVIEYCIDNGLMQTAGTSLSSESGGLFDQAPSDQPTGVLVVSNSLSERALRFAHALGIEVDENHSYCVDYPCIKCNISSSGQKIYHLPFDQQYDRVVIEPGKGEFYASTVNEAESRGFRRAFRWKGSSSD